MSWIEIITFGIAVFLGFGLLGFIQSRGFVKNNSHWARGLIMTVTSFFSGSIMFALIGLALSPSDFISERVITALQFGLLAGSVLAVSCLFLYFLAWLFDRVASLFGSNHP